MKHEDIVEDATFESYDHPAGGWGSLKAVTSILAEERVLVHGTAALMKQNKPDGFACVCC